MIATWLVMLLIVVASVAIGRAAMLMLGWERPTWLAGAAGFAALVVLAPLLVHLPGRGLTAAILLGLLTIGCTIVTRRAVPKRPEEGTSTPPPRALHLTALVAVIASIALASLPFLFNERTGVLGEGIYTNDQGAQLYWADWLADGFGPQPKAVEFGYPTGPQAVAAAVSEGTGFDLVDVFNGLLLAIPALTALAALAALESRPPGRRTLAAVLTGLPYLGASFLAQSGFKETAMALFVVAMAVAWSRRDVPARALVGITALLGAASVFTFSIPGLAWLAIALPIWLALRIAASDADIEFEPLREVVSRNRRTIVVGTVALAALLALAIGPAVNFMEKLDDVGLSQGRLSSPVFPGEALGIWPEGDFRVVRGEVEWAIPAVAFAGLCLLGGAIALLRRREWSLLAVLVAAGAIYALSRAFASIHVEAKALAALAPIAMLVVVRWLLGPSRGSGWPQVGRQAAGAAFVVLALGSTLLALRAAPVGFDERQQDLEQLGERIQGESVLFLGVDRFAGYYLRGTLVASPGGYVPPEVRARPEKVWQQGLALDFDTVEPSKLDRFRYAIITAAAFQSAPPPNWTEVAREGDYLLWKRHGETPRSRVLGGEGGDPGQVLDCARDPDDRRFSERTGNAVYQPIAPVTSDRWEPGVSFPLEAPAAARTTVRLSPASWRLSLQYHSQVPLRVLVNGEAIAELPPSLEGIYLTSPGRGAFWPAGEVRGPQGIPSDVTVSVRSAEPSGLQGALGVERRTWLGTLAFTPEAEPRQVPLADACGLYVDHFSIDRGGTEGPSKPSTSR